MEWGNLKLRWWLLGIIPFAYLLIGFHYNFIIGMQSLRNMDPEYIYFISGLSISEGKLDIGHVDNPGTPLQYLAALTFRITHWIRPQREPYLNDLLLHSDLYLNMVNHVVNLVTSLVLFAGGLLAFKFTKSLAYALILQTVPFYSEITYDIVGRLIPELLTPIPVLLTSVILLRVIRERQVSMTNLALLAILSAFGLSLKYTYITLLIIPLMAIPGWLNKGKFAGLVILFFCIFALPAVLKLETTWKWLTGLLVHSGQYGKGEGNYIEWEAFRTNLFHIYRTTESLFYLAGVLVIVILTAVIGRKMKFHDLWTKISIGVIVVIILHLMMVSKHYAYRYLIPILGLMPLIILLSADGLMKIISRPFFDKVMVVVLILLFIPGTMLQVKSMHTRSSYMTADVSQRMKAWNFVQNLGDDNVFLISGQGYGNPFHEKAMIFSDAWAGKQRKLIRPVLKDIYPDSYFYLTWDQSLRTFGQPWDSLNIFSRNKPVYLFIENDGQESLDRSMKFFFGEAGINGTLSTEKKFVNEKTKEGIYLLTPVLVPEILQ